MLFKSLSISLGHLTPGVPPSRELPFRVLARLGFPRPPRIVKLQARVVRLFHENVTLEVDLDDDGLGNTIIIKYNIGVKQGGTPAPSPSPSPGLFLCYIPTRSQGTRHWQAALETLFPKFEAAGIGKLMFRSMQPKRAASVNGEMAVGSAPSWPNRRLSFIAACVKLPICQSAWL